mmetsp:Transcript_47816/g.133339  ORF Transcript_47816/g.133339 Transcript_47816/m.133339 type:complete len:324 (-) Transcript_47816:139-1110(-)
MRCASAARSCFSRRSASWPVRALAALEAVTSPATASTCVDNSSKFWCKRTTSEPARRVASCSSSASLPVLRQSWPVWSTRTLSSVISDRTESSWHRIEATSSGATSGGGLFGFSSVSMRARSCKNSCSRASRSSTKRQEKASFAISIVCSSWCLRLALSLESRSCNRLKSRNCSRCASISVRNCDMDSSAARMACCLICCWSKRSACNSAVAFKLSISARTDATSRWAPPLANSPQRRMFASSSSSREATFAADFDTSSNVIKEAVAVRCATSTATTFCSLSLLCNSDKQLSRTRRSAFNSDANLSVQDAAKAMMSCNARAIF